MNRSHGWLVLVIVVLLLSACAPSAPPAPAPTAAPAAAAPKAAAPAPAQPTAKAIVTTPTPGTTGGPAVVDDGRWTRIQASGKLLVGTSSGSTPFARYEADFHLNGFDVALAREIGRRLSLQVQVLDFAAEGLPDALQTGQIDVGISSLAASLTGTVPVELTRPYFISNAAVLARQNVGLDTVRTLADLTRRRIGVQQGTRFETWARDNLVAAGQISAADLLVYRDIELAVSDLTAGRSDALLLDSTQARGFASRGGLTLAGDKMEQNQRAIAVPAGSIRLREEIDRVLTQANQDGTLDQLAGQYLGPESADLLPRSASGPVDRSRSPVSSTDCLDGAAWVADLTFAHNAMQSPPTLLPGQAFVKEFRLRNTGSCAWEPGYALSYALGSSPQAQMSGKSVVLQGAVPPGAESDIPLTLVAPATPGLYRGAWEMRDKRGVAFGERISVGIAVQQAPTPAPSPVPTVPVGSLIADHTRIKPGECVTVAWNIQNIQAVYFNPEGQPWEQHPTTGEESRQLCPSTTTTYELRLVRVNGSSEVRRVTIIVDAGADAPIQIGLTTAPESQIRRGECVDLTWKVQGKADRVRILRDESVLWDSAPQLGNLRDCPSGTSSVLYAVVAAGPAETVQTQRILKITQ